MLDRTGSSVFVKFQWTPERIKQLKELHAEGFPYSQIGDKLGTTRNACIGKAKRLKLTRLVDRDKRYPKRRLNRSGFVFGSQSQRQHLTSLILNLQPEPPPPQNNAPMVALLDLKEHHCRYPVGTGPYMFCGAPKVFTQSYCGVHHRICYGR